LLSEVVPEPARSPRQNGQSASEVETSRSRGEEIELRFHKNGNKLCEKTYLVGKLQGSMTIYYENGSRKSEYFFVHGILQGVAFRYLEDGSVVEDIWEDGDEISSTLSRLGQNSLPQKKFRIQRPAILRIFSKAIRFAIIQSTISCKLHRH
jgi:hypothetical protein